MFLTDGGNFLVERNGRFAVDGIRAIIFVLFFLIKRLTAKAFYGFVAVNVRRRGVAAAKLFRLRGKIGSVSRVGGRRGITRYGRLGVA